MTSGMGLFIMVFVALGLALPGPSEACNTENVERCVKGVYDSANTDPALLPLSPDQLTQFCSRVSEARGCIMRESEGCPDRARAFLEASMEGLKVVYEDLCKKHNMEKHAGYLKNAQCIFRNPAKECMQLHLKQLDAIAASNVTSKVDKACCNMQFYSLCARASITKACGVAAADDAMDLINSMTQGPMLASCGHSIPGSDHCRNAPYIHVASQNAPRGSLLSLHLKIILSEPSLSNIK